MIRLLRRLGLFTVSFTVLVSALASAQTLEIIPAGKGGEVLVVSAPLADAFGIAWVEVGEDGAPTVRSVAGPALMASSQLERILGSGEDRPLPPVVAVTGSIRPDEVSGLVGQLAAGRPAAAVSRHETPSRAEGGVRRRLGRPGSEATLRLTIPLPPRDDTLRSPAEVLATLLPGVPGVAMNGLSVRLDGDAVVLTAPVAAELAEGRLERLRLALARFADDPSLKPGEIERARSKLAVRRLVTLVSNPAGAETVVRWWLAGGDRAVRELLFGLEGVGPHRLAEAARRWLAVHPGEGELRLPPRVLNPRFAAGPVAVELPSGATAMLLERPVTPLEAVVIRPVLTPDLEGAVTASVLARLAAEIRQLPQAPGWVEVRKDPARLELAAPAGDVASLLEALGKALAVVGADTTPVAGSGGAEASALGLMADSLGLTVDGPLSPARLLEADNLALGALVTDAEAAREALLKLLGEAQAAGSGTVATDLTSSTRSRLAITGTTSCLVVRLDGMDGSPSADTALALVRERVASLGELTVRLVEPRVPGQAPALLVVTAEAALPDLESRLAGTWDRLTAPPTEDELETVRKAVLRETAQRWTGPVGRAALMAAVAAGQRSWSPPAQWPVRILAVEAGDLEPYLARWRAWDELETTGAGPFPVGSVPLPEPHP